MCATPSVAGLGCPPGARCRKGRSSRAELTEIAEVILETPLVVREVRLAVLQEASVTETETRGRARFVRGSACRHDTLQGNGLEYAARHAAPRRLQALRDVLWHGDRKSGNWNRKESRLFQKDTGARQVPSA